MNNIWFNFLWTFFLLSIQTVVNQYCTDLGNDLASNKRKAIAWTIRDRSLIYTCVTRAQWVNPMQPALNTWMVTIDHVAEFLTWYSWPSSMLHQLYKIWRVAYYRLFSYYILRHQTVETLDKISVTPRSRTCVSRQCLIHAKSRAHFLSMAEQGFSQWEMALHVQRLLSLAETLFSHI